MTAQAERFWQFSLRFYAMPQVRESCLLLQDEAALNVNVLLWCCWQASQGRLLTPGELRDAVTRITGWSAEVTQPLRALRRHVKAALDEEIAAAARARAYERLKAAELEAEKVEQSLLCRAASAGTETTGRDAQDLAKANLCTYMGSVDTPATERYRRLRDRLAHRLTCMESRRGAGGN